MRPAVAASELRSQRQLREAFDLDVSKPFAVVGKQTWPATKGLKSVSLDLRMIVPKR